MSSLGTSLLENLRAMYRSYGGPKSVLRSAYLWIALVLSAVSWRRIADESWSSAAQAILPNLAGFSIAAFAILFAILDARARRALRAPAEKLGGRSPLLVLASSVTHSVVVQIFALLFAFSFVAKPFPTVPGYECAAVVVTLAFSAVGLLIFLYAVVLVLATVLTIFKILEIAP